MKRPTVLISAVAGAVFAAALWWRKHPSACPYGQRFWIDAPHPLITRDRLRDAMAPKAGETVLEVGPGTGYYALFVARSLLPDGVLHIVDVQQEMLDHTMRRARLETITNIEPRLGDTRALPYDDGRSVPTVCRYITPSQPRLREAVASTGPIVLARRRTRRSVFASGRRLP